MTALWEGSVSCRALAIYWELIRDRKHFSFLVQVIDRGHLNVAGGYADGRVLSF